VDIAPQHRPAAVIFANQRIAIDQIPRKPGQLPVGLVKPPRRVIAHGSAQRARIVERGADPVDPLALLNQPVLDAVEINERAVIGEIAVGVIAVVGAADMG
jgi:hypothetical protein